MEGWNNIKDFSEMKENDEVFSRVTVWSNTFTGSMEFIAADVDVRKKDYVITHDQGVDVFPRHSIRRISCDE